jgi:hypothetical protein
MTYKPEKLGLAMRGPKGCALVSLVLIALMVMAFGYCAMTMPPCPRAMPPPKARRPKASQNQQRDNPPGTNATIKEQGDDQCRMSDLWTTTQLQRH